MGLRDKVALVHTALYILFILQVFCMPKIKKNIKGISKYCNAQNRIKQEKAKIENNIEALYKKYNFPETEFATGFKPSPCYDVVGFDQNTFNEAVNNKNAFQKFKKKNARKIANKARKAHQSIHNNLDSTLENTPRFSSSSYFGNYPNFPEVEYPMTATDIWKPNYWSDFFQSADNIQNNGFDICKPCNIKKKKYKSTFKNTKIPVKVKTTRPVQNFTNEEVCPLNIYSQTTKAPYFNNFVIKDYFATKPVDDCAIPKTTPLSIYNKSMENNASEQENSEQISNTENSVNDTCNAEPENYICFDNANKTSTIEEKSAQHSETKESDIELDEEFTTDEPEYAFALSTPLPFSTVDTWKNIQVIDPYKSLSYPDELDDYFITA